MRVAEIMTIKIVAVRQDAPVKSIAPLLFAHGISAVPVLLKDRSGSQKPPQKCTRCYEFVRGQRRFSIVRPVNVDQFCRSHGAAALSASQRARSKRSRRPTIGTLPGLAEGSILNATLCAPNVAR
jgi:CBS domain-containing protein